jgi:hypothetical protein
MPLKWRVVTKRTGGAVAATAAFRPRVALAAAAAVVAALGAGLLLRPPAPPVARTAVAELPLAVAIVRPELPGVLAVATRPPGPAALGAHLLAAAAPPEPRPLARPAGLARPTAVARTGATRRQAPPAATPADRLVRGLLGPPARAITQAAREFKRLTGTDRRRN